MVMMVMMMVMIDSIVFSSYLDDHVSYLIPPRAFRHPNLPPPIYLDGMSIYIVSPSVYHQRIVSTRCRLSAPVCLPYVFVTHTHTQTHTHTLPPFSDTPFLV